jgi:hypothetical protein
MLRVVLKDMNVVFSVCNEEEELRIVGEEVSGYDGHVFDVFAEHSHLIGFFLRGLLNDRARGWKGWLTEKPTKLIPFMKSPKRTIESSDLATETYIFISMNATGKRELSSFKPLTIVCSSISSIPTAHS